MGKNRLPFVGGLVWGEAIRFAAIPGVLALAAAVYGHPFWGVGFGLLALGVAAFFRDPSRGVSAPADVILSPADGRVLEVRTETAPAGYD